MSSISEIAWNFTPLEWNFYICCCFRNIVLIKDWWNSWKFCFSFILTTNLSIFKTTKSLYLMTIRLLKPCFQTHLLPKLLPASHLLFFFSRVRASKMDGNRQELQAKKNKTDQKCFFFANHEATKRARAVKNDERYSNQWETENGVFFWGFFCVTSEKFPKKKKKWELWFHFWKMKKWPEPGTGERKRWTMQTSEQFLIN